MTCIRFNLAESSVADTPLRDLGVSLDDLVLMYGDHLGRPGLRAAIAAGGDGLTADDVLVTPGAATALFIIATTLLRTGDHLVVACPNYATNLETPHAIGADVGYLDLRYEDGWAVDPDLIQPSGRPRSSSPSRTRTTRPARRSPDATARAILGLVEAHPHARLLMDETYREMTFGGSRRWPRTCRNEPSACLRSRKRTGCPAPDGWLATRDRTLLERFLAAKEQYPHHELGRGRGHRRGRDGASRRPSG